MSARILYLTAGYGEGHNAAARALALATAERYGEGAGRVVDVFALGRPRLNAFTRRAYLSLINRAPRVWRSTYAWLDRSPRAAQITTLLRREIAVLRETIRREKPEALCCTYPAYAFMADLLRCRGVDVPPLFNVVTDSISINSLWWRAPCAGWFVPNEDSADVLDEAGVDRHKVRVLGFPVASFFADQRAKLAPPSLVTHPPRVLCVINSGTRGAADVARRLLAEPEWDITCTVGRDEALRTELMRATEDRPRPTPILGWTDEIPRLLMTHHVVVSKAGGATTQEAIAARCPMLVNQIVPGQEEGNYELLRRHGIGALTLTPDAVVSELRRAFADEGRTWRRWRSAVDKLARPNAARDIVAALLPADVSATERKPWFFPAL